MRVAVLTDNDFGKVNGVTTTWRAVLDHMPEDVHARVYTAASVAESSDRYLALRSPGIGLPWYRAMTIHWPRFRRLARAIRQDRIDLIHVNTPGPVGLAGRLLARRLHLPLVGSYHTQFGHYVTHLSGSRHLGRMMDGYLRWFYADCERLLVPSDATRRFLVSLGCDAERTALWVRGVDTVRFDPARRSTSLREAWNVSPDRPAILYAGRISREKGLALMRPIEAVLRAHGVPHRFIFAGGGPLLGDLRQCWQDPVFLGEVTHEQMAMVMASADVLLFPSATDTLGNVVLEAQASGLPVIVSDEGGPRENVVDGSTGYVCRAGDGLEFAARLSTLLRDANRRRTLGDAARAYAESRSWHQALCPLFRAWREVARRSVRASSPTIELTVRPARP